MTSLNAALVVQNAMRQDGQGRAMLELARSLAGRGHRVTVYAHRIDDGLRDTVDLSPITRVRGPQLLDDLALMRAATRRIRATGHDVACILGPTALPSCPTVFYAQFSHRGWRETWDRTARPRLYHRLHARALEALERRCVDRATRVVATSPVLGDDIAGDTATPVDVVPNGIDLEEFTPVADADRHAARASLGLPVDAFVVGFLGDYSTPRKGLEPLIRAVALGGPGNRLVVAGRGDEGRYRRIAAGLGIADRVLFPGFLPARQILTAADTVAVPSLYEPFSLVALEAAACAVPVVISARAGAAPLLGDGAVIVHDPADPVAIHHAIRRVREMDSGARLRMGKAARAAAEALAWPAVAGRVADVVESVARSENVVPHGA